MAVVRHDGPDLRRTHEQEGGGIPAQTKTENVGASVGEEKGGGGQYFGMFEGQRVEVLRSTRLHHADGVESRGEAVVL